MKKRKKYKPTKDLLPRGKAMSEEPDEFKISFIKFEFEVVKTYYRLRGLLIWKR